MAGRSTVMIEKEALHSQLETLLCCVENELDSVKAAAAAAPSMPGPARMSHNSPPTTGLREFDSLAAEVARLGLRANAGLRKRHQEALLAGLCCSLRNLLNIAASSY